MPQRLLCCHFSIQTMRFLATPVCSKARTATAAAGDIAQVQPGVPPAHGRQHRAQIKNAASAAQHLHLFVNVRHKHKHTESQQDAAGLRGGDISEHSVSRNESQEED